MNTANALLMQLNDYTFQVNRDMISHLQSSGTNNERILQLISHTVSAQQVWLERMAKKSMSVGVFDVRTFDDLLTRNQLNHQTTTDVLNTRDLDEKIRYVNTRRQRFENSIAEMFLHLFNHATYHRGQINQLLVQEGKQPMVSDFIVYKRSEIL